MITSNPYDQVELSYDGTLLDAASMAAGVSSPNFSAPAKWQQDILSQLNLHGEGAILKVILTFLTCSYILWYMLSPRLLNIECSIHVC